MKLVLIRPSETSACCGHSVMHGDSDGDRMCDGDCTRDGDDYAW